MLTRVAKFEMRVTAEKSAMSAISRVRSNDCNRSAQNLEIQGGWISDKETGNRNNQETERGCSQHYSGKEAETDLRGLRSMQTLSKMSLRN